MRRRCNRGRNHAPPRIFRVGDCARRGFLLGLAGVSGPALREPVALAIHLEDVDVVGQAIEQSAGQSLGSEGLGPLVERQLAGDERGRSPRQKQQHELEEERRRQRQLELERQRELDRDLGWEL